MVLQGMLYFPDQGLILLDIIKGFDDHDPTCLPTRSRTRIAENIGNHGSKKQLRIGVPLEYNIAELEPKVREAWLCTLERLQDQGHCICQVSLPATKLALSAYYVIAPAEASSNLARYDTVRYGKQGTANGSAANVLYAISRGHGLGEEVKRRILLGAYTLSAGAIDNYFLQAQRIRRIVQRDFDSVFALQRPLSKLKGQNSASNRVDILLTPSVPSFPYPLASLANRSPVDTYSDDVLTVPSSLAGLPAMSIPIRMARNSCIKAPDDELVAGIQIIAQYGNDDILFQVAQTLESEHED